ncbi:hypothetical protein Btru_077497 [Bulinus truncatus]|nr:hypothetical protein Btru_077497 [Bulinus truncatus]
MEERTKSFQECPNKELWLQTHGLLRALVNERMGLKNTSQKPLPPDLYKTMSDWFSHATDYVEKYDGIKELLQNFPHDRCEYACREVITTIFADEKITLGRVLSYFSFAYHLCVQFPDSKEQNLRITGDLLDEFVIPWVAGLGGWESVISSAKKNPPDDLSTTRLACYIAASAIGMYLVYKSVV